MSGPFPGAQAVTQFGQFVGACGEAAATVLSAIETGGQATIGGVNALVEQLQGAGLAASQGQTTLSGLQYGLQQQGISTERTSFDQALQAVAQGQPAILEVAQGGKLPGHTDTSLQYHFIALVGSDSSGYFVADSDTAAGQSGQLLHETAAQLQAAAPYGALVAQPPAGPVSGIVTNQASFAGWPGQVIAAFANFNTLAQMLTSGAFWGRLGLILLGAILLFIGLSVFIHPAEERAAKDVGEVAAVAA